MARDVRGGDTGTGTAPMEGNGQVVRPISLQQRMREMSSRMVEATNASQSDVSYDPDFVLHTIGGGQNIAAFRAGHQRVHATGSRCAVA